MPARPSPHPRARAHDRACTQHSLDGQNPSRSRVTIDRVTLDSDFVHMSAPSPTPSLSFSYIAALAADEDRGNAVVATEILARCSVSAYTANSESVTSWSLSPLNSMTSMPSTRASVRVKSVKSSVLSPSAKTSRSSPLPPRTRMKSVESISMVSSPAPALAESPVPSFDRAHWRGGRRRGCHPLRR